MRAGNHATSGPFAPIVVVVRNAMGVKEFNQLRGKAISLHSQGVCGAGQAAVGGSDDSRIMAPWMVSACSMCCTAQAAARRRGTRPPTRGMPLPHPHVTRPAPMPRARAPAVIKSFCGQIGADGKQVQGLIRLAKKNGEKLGFLA